MTRIVWNFIWTGLAGIATAYAELGRGIAAFGRARMRLRSTRPRHRFEQVDRGYRDEW